MSHLIAVLHITHTLSTHPPPFRFIFVWVGWARVDQGVTRLGKRVKGRDRAGQGGEGQAVTR